MKGGNATKSAHHNKRGMGYQSKLALWGNKECWLLGIISVHLEISGFTSQSPKPSKRASAKCRKYGEIQLTRIASEHISGQTKLIEKQ